MYGVFDDGSANPHAAHEIFRKMIVGNHLYELDKGKFVLGKILDLPIRQNHH